MTFSFLAVFGLSGFSLIATRKHNIVNCFGPSSKALSLGCLSANLAGQKNRANVSSLQASSLMSMK